MAVLYEEGYWANSQLSIVRRTGAIRVNGQEFIIVNKEGIDIFECSEIADREGRDKAIEPGEPCDLVDMRFVKYYKKMGRDAFIKFMEENQTLGPKELLKKLKES